MKKILENICNGASGLCIKKWFQIAIVPALILIALPVNATIIGGNVTGGTAGGSFFKLSVPLSGSTPFNSVGENNFNDNNLYGFDEDQNILLAATLALDIDNGTTTSAGDYVASHYIFFDPGPTRSITGTVDFDSEVLGIITSKSKLQSSDFLANTGVNYLSPTYRGLESGDSVWISGLQQIELNFSAGNPGDYIRVITTFSPQAAVPEPSTVILLGIGLAGLGGGYLRRRRKKTNCIEK